MSNKYAPCLYCGCIARPHHPTPPHQAHDSMINCLYCGDQAVPATFSPCGAAVLLGLLTLFGFAPMLFMLWAASGNILFGVAGALLLPAAIAAIGIGICEENIRTSHAVGKG